MNAGYRWCDADFTLDGRHRWSLTRRWGAPKPGYFANPDERMVLFVMLNPSKAGKLEDDSTIRRCVGFARRWGYTGVRVMNLFSLVATNPRELYAAADPGPLYETRMLLASKEAALTVVAWGAVVPQARVLQRIQDVLQLLKDPQCLGVTKEGHPRHPLYVPYAATLAPFGGGHARGN